MAMIATIKLKFFFCLTVLSVRQQTLLGTEWLCFVEMAVVKSLSKVVMLEVDDGVFKEILMKNALLLPLGKKYWKYSTRIPELRLLLQLIQMIVMLNF